MKRINIKKFLKSPTETLIEQYISSKQDELHSDDEVYLSSKGQLILNLKNSQVQEKLANQISDFAKIDLTAN